MQEQDTILQGVSVHGKGFTSIRVEKREFTKAVELNLRPVWDEGLS